MIPLGRLPVSFRRKKLPMLFPMKRRRHAVVMAAGSVVFVGDERRFETTFAMTEYGREVYRTSTPSTADEAIDAFDGKSVVRPSVTASADSMDATARAMRVRTGPAS